MKRWGSCLHAALQGERRRDYAGRLPNLLLSLEWHTVHVEVPALWLFRAASAQGLISWGGRLAEQPYMLERGWQAERDPPLHVSSQLNANIDKGNLHYFPWPIWCTPNCSADEWTLTQVFWLIEPMPAARDCHFWSGGRVLWSGGNRCPPNIQC